MTCTTHHHACDCREEKLNDLMAAMAEFIDIACRADFSRKDGREAKRVASLIARLSAELGPIPKSVN